MTNDKELAINEEGENTQKAAINEEWEKIAINKE